MGWVTDFVGLLSSPANKKIRKLNSAKVLYCDVTAGGQKQAANHRAALVFLVQQFRPVQPSSPPPGARRPLSELEQPSACPPHGQINRERNRKTRREKENPGVCFGLMIQPISSVTMFASFPWALTIPRCVWRRPPWGARARRLQPPLTS